MRVSVVIPCYNAEAYLPQTIGSVLEQDRPVDEIVIVDDGSTDASLAVAQRFAARHPSLVRVFSQRSGNASRTRNLGAQIATGDAIMFLDADDVLDPRAIAGLSAALESVPDGIAVCRWYRLELSGESWVRRPPSCAPRRPGQSALSDWLVGWYHPPCSVLWSRRAFERAGRWDERRSPNDDGDLTMRALADGVPLVDAATGASFYRRLPAGEASWSAARFTQEGLQARVRTVEKIAAWLEHREALPPYRSALHAALLRIREDAGDEHPDVARSAEALARRYRVPAARLRARTGGARARVQQRVGPRLQRLRHPAQHRGREPGLMQVRYGLRIADEVMSAAASPASMLPVPSVQRPLVSVIVPTYNRAPLLRRTLDSVLAQTVEDMEVLVVDDGSTDTTEDVVNGFGDPRVRYLRQPENAGVGAARNRGLRAARGEFLAFLDSDDEWLPAKLALQLERFAQLPDDVGLVYSGVEDHDGAGGVVVQTPSHRGDVYADLLVRNVLHGGGSNAMIRRAAVAAAGFFDEHLPAIEDYDYWVRIARFYAVDFVEEPVVRYHDVRDAVRRSVDASANRAARAVFYRRYEAEMRRVGVRHLFLAESARRHIDEDPVDRAGARTLAARAVLVAPGHLPAWVILARTLTPSRLRTIGRTVLRLTGRLPAQPSASLVVLLYSAQPWATGGGVQAVCSRLSAGLRARGHTVVEAGPDVAQVSEPPVATLSLALLYLRRGVLPRLVAGTRSLWAAHRAVRAWRPDVVNVHYVEGHAVYFFLLRKLLGYRIVLSAHGSDVLLFGDSGWVPWLLPRADAVTAVSSPVASRVVTCGGIEPDRVQVIPNGVDLDFWSEGPSPRRAAPGRTVVTVGRLHPVKGHDVLLDALALLRDRVPGARLVLVGDGAEAAALQRQAAALGLGDAVESTGRLSAQGVRDQLRRADVFALPSRSEGMPVSLLEAMAAGLPSVATAVGGVPDVLVAGAGVLVPPEDAVALADALARVLSDDDLARTLAEGGRARSQEFSASAVDDAYERLFQRLAASSGRRRRRRR